MDFTALVLPRSFLVFGWLGLAGWAWRWLMSGDWRALRDPARLNLFLGATVAVLALWQIRSGVRPGLSFHLYGIPALTLMFGFWRATLAGILVLLINASFGRGAFAALGLDALVQVMLPALVSWYAYRFVERHLPTHLFIYLLGNGFFGAAIAVSLIGLVTTALMALAGAYPLAYLLSNYTPYAALLISWAEAFSTGMVITMMAVYRPAWLETFDDVKYFQTK